MIRLRVVAAGQTTTFQHGGPVVTVGRDPACELAFEGEASSGVSRQHARIEVGPGGAALSDAGSSNGTLLNDKPVEGKVPLRVGDRINLGYTGPALTVLSLDLAPAEVRPPAAAGSGALLALFGGGAVVGLVLVLGIVMVVLLRQHGGGEDTAPVAVTTTPAPPPHATGPAVVPAETGKVPPAATTRDTAPERRGTETPVEATPEPAAPVIAEAVEEPVGHYVSLPEWGPSVLLSRRGGLYPWAPLRPEQPVLTGRSLMSLPGYRSEVMVDGKDGKDPRVQLTLWGNIPELCGIPPLLLESVAMLNASGGHSELSPVDADVTLEWGRIKIANRKESGPARVRLRFQHEIWELTLPGQDSEVVAELWSVLPPVSGAERQRPLVLGLFTNGPAVVERTGPRSEHLDLRGRTRVAWSSGSTGKLFQQAMDRPPPWWGKPSDSGPGHERVQDALGALVEWAKRLSETGDRQNKTSDLVSMTLGAIRDTDDLSLREEAMYFLSALGEAPYLVKHLEDGRHSRVRRASAHALRAWLSRSPGRSTELVQLLKVQTSTPQKAVLIQELLYPYTADDLKKPDTYQKLIGYLDDDSLAVRELAAWRLEDLAPGKARDLPFDASASPEQRREVIAAWHRALPPGRLPPPPAQ